MRSFEHKRVNVSNCCPLPLCCHPVLIKAGSATDCARSFFCKLPCCAATAQSNQEGPLKGHRKQRQLRPSSPLPVFFLLFIKDSPSSSLQSSLFFLSSLLSLSLPDTRTNFRTFCFSVSMRLLLSISSSPTVSCSKTSSSLSSRQDNGGPIFSPPTPPPLASLHSSSALPGFFPMAEQKTSGSPPGNKPAPFGPL